MWGRRLVGRVGDALVGWGQVDVFLVFIKKKMKCILGKEKSVSLF